MKNNKLIKALKKISSAYREPEWIQVIDYSLEIPPEYYDIINEEDRKKNRIPAPTTYSMARYDTEDGRLIDGVVYQYSMTFNPVNVSYAYRLFVDSQTIAKSGGLGSIHEARNLCNEEAKKTIV